LWVSIRQERRNIFTTLGKPGDDIMVVGRWFVLYSTLFLLSTQLYAVVPVDRTTPRQALRTFLTSTDERVEDYNTAALVLQNTGIPSAEAVQRARHLREIIRGKGLYVRLESVPNSPEYLDTTTQLSEFRPFPKEPRISLVRDGENWVFSAYTVQSVPMMYDALYPFGLEFFADLTPAEGTTFIGLYLWQWLGIGILLIVAFLCLKALQPVAAWFVGWCFRRFRLSEPEVSVYKHIGRSLALLATSSILALLLPLLRLPLHTSQYAVLVLNVLIPLFAIITAYRLVDAVVEHIAWKTSKGRHTHTQLRPLIRRALKLVVIIVGIVAILQQFDVNLTAVIAGLSIGGVAIALASQDTIRNFLGAIMILTDKPFVVGDHVIVQGAEGVVEDIGLRSTRLRSLSNSIVYIPNGRLADMTVDNLGLRVMRQYKITLNLAYDTDPEQLSKFIDGLHAIIREHPHTIKTPETASIAFSEYGDYSLKVLFQCYFEPSSPDEQQSRMDINVAIRKLASDLGVSFAVPPHTIIQAGNTL